MSDREPAVTGGELPGLGRSIAVSVAASTSVVLILVTLGLVAAGASFVDALGIGALAALWGGGGFGVMLGGVLFVNRADRQVPIASPGHGLAASPRAAVPARAEGGAS